MRLVLAVAWLLAALPVLIAPAAARGSELPRSNERARPAARPGEAAVRAAYLDKSGVVRWRDSNGEVALFGANYCIMSGSDYRMAGLVSHDRKAMIDEDLAQFARMGWTGLRLCSWATGKMPTGTEISSSTSTSICSIMSLRKPVSAASTFF